MSPFDIVVLVIIGLSALFALSRGFVTELLSLLAWAAAWVATRLFYAPARDLARSLIHSVLVADVVAYAVLFFGVLIGVRLIANAAGSRVKDSAIGIVDRLLGAAFGAVRGLLIVSALYALFGLVTARERMPAFILEARTKPLLDLAADAVINATRAVRGDSSTTRQNGPPDADSPAPPLEDTGYNAPARDDLDNLVKDKDSPANPR